MPFLTIEALETDRDGLEFLRGVLCQRNERIPTVPLNVNVAPDVEHDALAAVAVAQPQEYRPAARGSVNSVLNVDSVPKPA